MSSRLITGLLLLCAVAFAAWRIIEHFTADREIEERQQAIDEYNRLGSLAMEDPASADKLESLIEKYRSYPAGNSWARSKFFAQIGRIGISYLDSAEGKKHFREMVIPEFTKALENPNEDEVVRFAAVAAAGDCEHLSAPLVPQLVKVMETYPHFGSGIVAVVALGEIGPAARDALPALEKIRQHNRNAQEAIEKIRRPSNDKG